MKKKERDFHDMEEQEVEELFLDYFYAIDERIKVLKGDHEERKKRNKYVFSYFTRLVFFCWVVIPSAVLSFIFLFASMDRGAGSAFSLIWFGVAVLATGPYVIFTSSPFDYYFNKAADDIQENAKFRRIPKRHKVM